MFRDAVLVAAKDLRVEARSRVATNQVLPFALLVLVLFAFALGTDRGTLSAAAGGLFWLAVLFSAMLAIQRSFGIEAADDARDALRLSGLDAGGIFLGKAGAIVVQLLLLEVVLGAGIVVLYDVQLHAPLLLIGSTVLATAGLAAAGVAYGMVAAGLRVRETLLPLLVLPALAPLLLAAARVADAALGGTPGLAAPWVRLLAVFTTVYVAFGVVAFGALLEES